MEKRLNYLEGVAEAVAKQGKVRVFPCIIIIIFCKCLSLYRPVGVACIWASEDSWRLLGVRLMLLLKRRVLAFQCLFLQVLNFHFIVQDSLLVY